MSSAPEDRSGVRIFPPLIYLGGLFLGFLLHWRLPLPIVPAVLVGPLRLLGAFCLVAGLALDIWAVATFRRAGTTPHPAGPATALVVGGPYRFTRNPMYLGLVCITAGLALLTNALWPLILLPIVIVIVRRAVIDREEHYLTAKFGEEYLRYKARVRRWL
ncbi:MAG: isoprenylcysteine carboxylmethyltransferase family protein [Planctomycetaceae bacterium]|nr:isoprenylcysteine carboxylmethyltransferase family protein [Planctomycetaceae bacterium]MBV8316036.1 isoprenylcysteine carboxylmethyltransferase family protein [Planctomycetaceae bacterium]